MSRTLTLKTNVDTLRKDAKRWLKAVRAGDAKAGARLLAAWPQAPAEPGLRDIQHALAMEYGRESWIALKAAIDDLALDRIGHAERVDQLLSHGWDGDPRLASRILHRHSDIARDSLFTAAACGDVAEVERRLAQDRQAATRTAGPKSWTALAYVTYSRLDLENAVAIARLLLAAGADPNFRFDDGWGNPFTLLTGAIGLGEGSKPSHPQALELVELLIGAGAAPYDTQALYNVSIVGKDIYWYDLLWRHCEAAGVLGMWRDADGHGIGGSLRLSALNYLLGNAVGQNHLERAEWLLERGADPNTPHAYTRQSVDAVAQLSGFLEIVALLERYHARRATLAGAEAFQAACLRLDEGSARALLAADPGLTASPAPLLAAAGFGNAPAVALLLSLGARVDGTDHHGISPLHSAVQSGSLETVDLLLAAGADVDLRERKWQGTPLSWSVVLGQPHLAERLAPLGRDACALASFGHLDRLEAVLGAGDMLEGQTPSTLLFCLPDHEERAIEVARLLLNHGADPRTRDKQGRTAMEAAGQRGLDDAALYLEDWRHER